MELVGVQELEMVVGGQGSTNTTLTVNNTFNVRLDQTNRNSNGTTTGTDMGGAGGAGGGGGSGGALAISAPGAVTQTNYFAFSAWNWV